jgi:hypothetical protein
VDRETGVLCAVAHLLASTGRRDIVDRVARADNNVWVPQLAGDTAFTRWLDAHGLTLAEAAFIQVPYVAPDRGAVAAVAGRSGGYAAASAAAVGGALAMSVWNARSNERGARGWRSAVGLGLGAAALGVGAAGVGVPARRRCSAPPARPPARPASGSRRAGSRAPPRPGRRARAGADVAQRAVVSPILPVGQGQGAGLSVAVPF